MKKKIAGAIVLIGVIMCGVLCFMRQPDDAITENVGNICLIEESTDPSVCFSSNPFDYVDKECYDNILAMGTDAIKPLQEQMDSGELSAQCQFVCGALLEKVTQCHMHDVAGECSNVEVFRELWDLTINSLPETLENIQNDNNMSVEEKQEELEKYGVFGKAFAKKAMKSDFEMGGEKISVTKDKKVKDMYDKLGSDISDKDVKNVIEYLDYKCKF